MSAKSQAQFAPVGEITVRGLLGEETPVKFEGAGDWVVTTCLCALCFPSCSDLFTVTHVPSTWSAKQHMPLDLARRLAAGFNERFPKFRSPRSLHVRSKRSHALAAEILAVAMLEAGL